MSNEQKSSFNPAILVVGILLMVGGGFMEQRHIGSVKEPLPLNLAETIATIGVFLILFPVIRSFFIQPLADAIQARNSELERTFSEAEELRAEMQKLRSDYEQRISATEASAREQIQSQIKEAQSLRQTLMAEAAEKADALVERAQQEIASERDRLLTELRTHVVDLALASAEKVIAENLDNDRNRRLIQDFINDVEVSR